MTRRHATQIEVTVIVEYDCHDADDGGRDYPSTPAYVEITSVKIEGVEVVLSDEQMETIQEEIEDKLAEQKHWGEE